MSLDLSERNHHALDVPDCEIATLDSSPLSADPLRLKRWRQISQAGAVGIASVPTAYVGFMSIEALIARYC